MADKIKIRRGAKVDLPTLDPGEPGYATDTEELFIGDPDGNKKINIADTDGLSEGSTNLYYTEGRVSANSSVAANTAKVSADGSIDTHSDVNTAGKGNGDVLTFNTASSKWEATAPAGGGPANVADGSPAGSLQQGPYSLARFANSYANAGTQDAVQGDMQVYNFTMHAKQLDNGQPVILKLGTLASPLGELDMGAVAPTKQVTWFINVDAYAVDAGFPSLAAFKMQATAVSQFGSAPIMNGSVMMADASSRGLAANDISVGDTAFSLVNVNTPISQAQMSLTLFNPALSNPTPPATATIVRLSGLDDRFGGSNSILTWWLAHVRIIEIITP